MTAAGKIGAGFGHYTSGAARLIAGFEDLNPGDSVADLLARIGLPEDMAMIVPVNGRLAGRQYSLTGGDAIFMVQTLADG